MSKPLSKEVIRTRMVQWRNDRRLEAQRRERVAILEARCGQLEQENAELRATVQKLLLRIEQLETMVFGRKREQQDHHDDDEGGAAPPSERQPRPRSSFRRPVPSPAEVTERTVHPIDQCPDCGWQLRKKERVTRFIEDIPLPKKTVKEQSIERGFCPRCRKTHAAIPLSPQLSALGPNVRLYILYAVTVLGQTFGKVRAHLQDVHDLAISDGEIAGILDEGHRNLLPARNDIAAKIREAPAAHYDETSYPVQHGEQGNYAWIKTSSTGPETLFLLGRTRGKGNAEEIRGPPSNQASVTDDYGAYDNLFHRQGLCWAHPIRKFRDLARSDVLPMEQKVVCQTFFDSFSTLEHDVAIAREAPLTGDERREAKMRFTSRIEDLMTPSVSDPPKLNTLKETFRENTDKYLLCVIDPRVPMTNNQAERRIRQLVIKRLLSFGSRTQKGAQIMETLLSVLLTLWWSKPKDYFGELRRLMPLQG
ncbi:MAG: IS66 family transposase [Candidatus Peregrinibacteria bacterium]